MQAFSGLIRSIVSPKPGPQVDAFYVENKNPSADSTFGVVKRKIDGDAAEYFVNTGAVKVKSAGNFSITPEEHGSTFYVTATAVASLPDAVKGLRYVIIWGVANNANAVSPSALDGIAAKGLTAVVNKDLVNSTSVIYDSVVLVAVDDNLWHATLSGTYTKEA